MIPPDLLDTIVTGDARELAARIPDGSVDLVFTDPVYDRLDDYRWLAETAARVLRPGGNCLAFVNAKWLPFLLASVPTHLPPLACVQTSGPSPMNGRIIAKTYYLAWWGSGALVGYMPDGYIGTAWGNVDGQNHRWTKNPKYLRVVLRAFTAPDAVVYDPFTGGGTVPAVCKMLGRHYIASEIDPATADLARARVANTQPPLFVAEPEQVAMALEVA